MRQIGGINMITLIKLMTFILGTLLLFLMIKRLFKGNYNMIIYPTVVFYFFFFLPLLYDITLGVPSYRTVNYGFIISANDPIINLIYCIIIIYIITVFYLYQKKVSFQKKLVINSRTADILFVLCVMAMTLYLFPIIFDQNLLQLILSYDMWYYKGDPYNQIKFYSNLFIISILFILFIEKRKKIFLIKLIFLLPYIYMGFMMNGKRNIVFVFIIGLLYILFNNRIIINKLVYIFLLPVIIASLFGYSSWYQTHFERISGDSFESKYTSYRINYGRDDTMKMVLYSELNKDFQILSKRGESFLFYPTFFVKREYWPEKPYPYAVYFTNAMLGRNSVEILGWGMTTTIFDEMISNIGVIGILLSPFFVILLINLGMKNSKGILGISILGLSMLLSILSIAVQLTAYLSTYLLFFFLIILYKLNERMGIKIFFA